MVKIFSLLVLLYTLSLASNDLHDKITSLITKSVYDKNKSFINIIFSDKESYYVDSRLDVIKVVQTLKDNGLMKLFFKTPRSFEVTFSTNSSPLFFVKLMSDTLHSMGYYRFITKNSRLNSSEFSWSVAIISEYATDPILLEKELSKRNCKVVDVTRISEDRWEYSIDVSYAQLNIESIDVDKQLVLKHSQQDHWVDVSMIKKLILFSLKGNNWYPYISYYDRSLRLLKVYKRDEKSSQITLELPKDCVYLKISDLYSLKNIKDGLRLSGSGEK